MAKNSDADQVLVGEIGPPHGVKGLMRLKSHTDEPLAIFDYGPLTDQNGKQVDIRPDGRSKGHLLIALDGVSDRDAAQALKGTRLYVPRAALPEPEADEFYQGDLLGLRCELADGGVFGVIKAVQDFGGGDLLEIAPAGGGPTVYLPFTREAVPLVDLVNRRVQVAPPDSTGDAEGEEGAEN